MRPPLRSAMAAAFNEQALDRLTKDAWRALSRRTEPRRAIREMRLQAENGTAGASVVFQVPAIPEWEPRLITENPRQHPFA